MNGVSNFFSVLQKKHDLFTKKIKMPVGKNIFLCYNVRENEQ